MKKILVVIFCVLGGLAVNAQSNQGITVTNNPFYQLPVLQSSPTDFRQAFSAKKPFAFSVYNKTTGLNDNYLSYRSNFSFSKSIAIANNPYRGAPIDSFNPYGSTHFGSAVLLGVLNSIF